jgi:phospholipid/cholesterol/gamma-HCH transport system permease protein
MGWVASTMAEPVSFRFFLNKGLNGVSFDDLLPSTFKTCVFGFIIGLVSCYQGMNTRGGTEGVGRSATSSVLLSSLFVILADVVLVRLIIVFFERV